MSSLSWMFALTSGFEFYQTLFFLFSLSLKILFMIKIQYSFWFSFSFSFLFFFSVHLSFFQGTGGILFENLIDLFLKSWKIFWESSKLYDAISNLKTLKPSLHIPLQAFLFKNMLLNNMGCFFFFTCIDKVPAEN